MRRWPLGCRALWCGVSARLTMFRPIRLTPQTRFGVPDKTPANAGAVRSRPVPPLGRPVQLCRGAGWIATAFPARERGKFTLTLPSPIEGEGPRRVRRPAAHTLYKTYVGPPSLAIGRSRRVMCLPQWTCPPTATIRPRPFSPSPPPSPRLRRTGLPSPISPRRVARGDKGEGVMKQPLSLMGRTEV